MVAEATLRTRGYAKAAAPHWRGTLERSIKSSTEVIPYVHQRGVVYADPLTLSAAGADPNYAWYVHEGTQPFITAKNGGRLKFRTKLPGGGLGGWNSKKYVRGQKSQPFLVRGLRRAVRAPAWTVRRIVVSPR
jgi:hypothetical protein